MRLLLRFSLHFLRLKIPRDLQTHRKKIYQHLLHYTFVVPYPQPQQSVGARKRVSQWEPWLMHSSLCSALLIPEKYESRPQQRGPVTAQWTSHGWKRVSTVADAVHPLRGPKLHCAQASCRLETCAGASVVHRSEVARVASKRWTLELCTALTCAQVHGDPASAVVTAQRWNEYLPPVRVLDDQSACFTEQLRIGYSHLLSFVPYVQCRPSHTPLVDLFVLSLCGRGGVQGAIRGWSFYALDQDPHTQPEDDRAPRPPLVFKLRYNVVNNRWCGRIGRPHKSNHIGYEVNLSKGTATQFCWDPECAGYKSYPPIVIPDALLPNEALQLHPLSAAIHASPAARQGWNDARAGDTDLLP